MTTTAPEATDISTTSTTVTAAEPSDRPTSEHTPVVAGFRVDRVAGLTTAALDLDATSVELVCAELDRVDQQVQGMSLAVSDLLYQLVPALGDDVATRRVVLAVRRTCGGGGSRMPSQDKADIVSAALGEHVDEEGQRLFDRWYASWGRRERLLLELETSYAGEVERSNEVIRDVLVNDGIGTGIAQASPFLGENLHMADLRPGKREARSIGGYLSRAARKTSPFSYLTGVSTTLEEGAGRAASDASGMGEAPDAAHADPGGTREVVAVSQGHVVAWLDALARVEELLPAFELEPLWTPGRNPITDSVLIPEVTRHDGFTWRRDKAVHIAELGRVLARLQYLGRRPAAEYLAAVGGEDAFSTIRRLIDVGVVRVVAPWGYGQTDRLDRLADAVAALGTERGSEVAILLRGLQQRVGALGTARGQERGKALVAVQAHAEQLIAQFGVSADEAEFTVYSDTRSHLSVGELGQHVRNDLVALGRAVRPLVFRSHVYDEVRARFTARYGVGGTCPDLHGFLSTVGDDADGLTGMFRAASLDERTKGRASERSELPVGRTSAAPAASVLYQVASAGLDQMRQGEFSLVVNQFHAGTGSLVSRFHGLDDGGLRRALRSWAAQMYPQARIVEFIASAGVNDMQSACEGTFPRLRWPTELPVAGDPAGSMDLDQLFLRHDAQRDVLEFVTRSGELVAPIYMGLVPAHMLGGPERILTVLADPWVNGASSTLRRLPPVAQQEGPLTAVPRQQHGRIVTKRATWTVRVQDLPRPERHESEASYLRRLNDWRRADGLPEHVFVRNRTAGHGMGVHQRKPFWVSFLSPHAIAQLLATIDKETTGLTFVEVLPGDSDLWLNDADGNPYVVEHLTHLRWERP